MYSSIGARIAAQNGPLHGGANEQVIHTLEQIGRPSNAKSWLANARARKQKIMGFGHRVYKTYDPRARILGPIARHLADKDGSLQNLFETALALEAEVVATLGVEKGIYPNVDFYSGLVYAALGIPRELFTPTFAVARAAGWTARVMEYLQNNRLFRPRAIYTGPLTLPFVPLSRRARKTKGKTPARERKQGAG
jgi:citrate synthase